MSTEIIFVFVLVSVGPSRQPVLIIYIISYNWKSHTHSFVIKFGSTSLSPCISITVLLPVLQCFIYSSVFRVI